MLMPLPATLRRLVKEYETLLAEEALAGGADPCGQRLRDLAYTLCVSTGTREIADALETARSYLAKAPVSTPSSAAARTSGRGHRAAIASPKSPSQAPGFHHAAVGQSPDRRDLALRPGHRPAASSAASAAKGSRS
ncbi:DUF5133 domain-containing protein [Streptomyces sp. NPDC048643]|uniref:DUF5133 domain-containing protein n=1 Tax=Streptomyces sp. NPDC048643 TaxID=3155637 RepID=UPI0034257761